MLILVLGMYLLIVLLCIPWLNKEVYISSYKAFFILFYLNNNGRINIWTSISFIFF